MATNEEVTVRMAYWEDVEKKRVVMAEASGEFVDILFSFLTLPLGTITRLQSENKFPDNQVSPQPLEIGCINNLYKSVRDLSPDVFQNNMCQKMLLSPRNPLEGYCQRLKLKVDDTPPTKHFVCPTCSTGSNLWVSTFEGATCSCRKLMDKETELLEEGFKEGESGVFVRGDATFLICDDLTVLPGSPGNAVLPLRNYQLYDHPTEVQVGMNRILHILKQALTSQTPLTDVFLNRNQTSDGKTTPFYPFSRCTGSSNNFKGSVEIKVIMSKSENKINFAETDGDFVDFLVSFLTISLGSILHLMNGRVSLGSIHNLYASVKNLDSSCFIGPSKKLLLNPGVAPQFGCKSIQVSALQEVPKYWYGVKSGTNSDEKKISKIRNMLRDPEEMKLFEPRCCDIDGARERAIGFMKRPCIFVVSDDLKVKTTANGRTTTTNATTSATNATTSTTSSIQYLRQQIQNHYKGGLRIHSVKITKSHKALNLLMASLILDKDVLTRNLFYPIKWKRQRFVLFWKKKKEKLWKKLKPNFYKCVK